MSPLTQLLFGEKLLLSFIFLPSQPPSKKFLSFIFFAKEI
jgi:hypothetical protein